MPKYEYKKCKNEMVNTFIKMAAECDNYTPLAIESVMKYITGLEMEVEQLKGGPG